MYAIIDKHGRDVSKIDTDDVVSKNRFAFLRYFYQHGGSILYRYDAMWDCISNERKYIYIQFPHLKIWGEIVGLPMNAEGNSIKIFRFR